MGVGETGMGIPVLRGVSDSLPQHLLPCPHLSKCALPGKYGLTYVIFEDAHEKLPETFLSSSCSDIVVLKLFFK